MSLIIYYGFLLTEKDVIELYPNLLDEGRTLGDYMSDCEHDASYLDLKITNKLIVETVTDTDKDQKIVIGVQLSRFDDRYGAALVIPEISVEATNIMSEFIEDNNTFKYMKPVIFAYMHVKKFINL